MGRSKLVSMSLNFVSVKATARNETPNIRFVFLQLELWSARRHDGLAKPKTFFVCFSFHFVFLVATLSKS